MTTATTDPHPFSQLSPDLIVEAVESTGRLSDLRVLALNSYENRVYQVGIEGETPLIAKFYRPQRWSDEQILEEHSFSQELVAAELPVVAPLADADGRTLFRYQQFRFALFPRHGGHAPELGDPDTLLSLGRLLARMHSIGELRPFEFRPTLDVDSFGTRSYQWVAEHAIPASLRPAYVTLAEDILALVRERFAATPPRYLRGHGDCHMGNILNRNDQFWFVDLDDSRMIPAMQDLWMMLSGASQEQTVQLSELLEGYNEFRDFDFAELNLIEPLRALRLLHFAAWLAQRWEDPAFPGGFPWFGSERYWADHILELREQFAALQEPPLRLC